MSAHVWEAKFLTEGVVERGARAYAKARENGLSQLDCLRFVAYYLETIRQKGGGFWGGHHLPNRLTYLGVVWAGAVKSGHRYAKGRNRANYLKGGRLWWKCGGKETY